MNSYLKTVWRNGQPPALNADNLNHIEQGIYDVTEEVRDLDIDGEVEEQTANRMYRMTELPQSITNWPRGQLGWQNNKPVISTGDEHSSNQVVLATEGYVDTVLTAIADALAAI